MKIHKNIKRATTKINSGKIDLRNLSQKNETPELLRPENAEYLKSLLDRFRQLWLKKL